MDIRRMRTAIMVVALLAYGGSLPAHATQQQQVEGKWTGGFRLKGEWVAIDVRFASQADTASSAADIFFPSYGVSQSATGVALSNFNQASDRLHLEIPFGEERVVLDGQLRGVRFQAITSTAVRRARSD